jgi:hypothetical protein
MTKHPKVPAQIAALTLTALVLTTSAWTPAFADGNPLDSVGVEHNVYLGCLMRNGGDPSVSPLRRVVEECGFNPGTSTDEFVALYSSLVEADPNLTVAERMDPYKASYTDYQFSYFHRIDQVMEVAQSQTVADEMFAQLESEAIARLTTSTAAEQSIFAALSTARHSLRYWSQATGTQDAAREPKLRKIWKVLIVVGADLVGAAGGTLIGGPVVGAATGSASSYGAAQVLK